jgi:hypothetical protein
MALSGFTHYEVRADATANNVNGGGFNPNNANMFTDLTTDTNTGNTASPIVSSASYNFVAGDVGNYVFIKAGTDWLRGWYKIVSVASNKATLDAAIGKVQQWTNRGTLNTVVGISSVGTPTNGTFAIDYCHATAAIVTNTDGAGAGTTTFTSAGSTFTKVMVGNLLHITNGGTGLTVGWYEIVSFTDATHVVLDRTFGTGTGATFFVGGAISLNSTLDDDFFDIVVAGGTVWVYAGGGTVSLAEAVDPANQGSTTASSAIWGYNTVRGDNPIGSDRPTINAAANNFAIASRWIAAYLIVLTTTANGFGNTGGDARQFVFVKSVNKSTSGGNAFTVNTNSLFLGCEAISYGDDGFVVNGSTRFIGCWAHACKNRAYDASGTNGNTLTMINCIASDFVSTGIATCSDFNGPFIITVEGCTIHGTNDTRGTGVNMSDGVLRYLFGCIISGCVTGVSRSTALPDNSWIYDDFNDYWNNDTDVSNWFKGPSDLAVNPSFTNVGQVTGTTGKFDAGGSKLIDTSKNFTALGVVAGDLVYISAGTGVSVLFYGITSISTTTNPNDTLNLDVSPGTSTTADKVYSIETGHDFLPTNTTVLRSGFPQTFPGGYTESSPPMGAVASITGGAGGTRAAAFVG